MRPNEDRTMAASDSDAYACLASPVSTALAQDPMKRCRHPLEGAGWLSQLTMWWMNETIRQGFQRPIEEDDVPSLPTIDRVAHLQRVFEEHYGQAKATHNTTVTPIHGAMWASTRRTMALAIVLYFVSAAASVLQPLLIKALLQFLQDPSSSNIFHVHSGYTLAGLLTVASLVSVSALDFGMFRATRAGIQARSIVVNAVFQKTLVLSSSARQAMNSGDIITLAGVDSERLYDAYANGLWAIVSPVMVAVVCLLIGFTMGAFVGLAAVVCAVAILTFAVTNSRKIGKLRRRILEVSGERVKVTNEALQGIRVIKMYAWERPILDRVAEIRQREIELLRSYNYMRAANYVVLTMGQTFMVAACLIVYVYQGDTLDVPTAFALLAFTNVCRMPFAVFSNAAVFTSEALASLQRIAKFLAADEVDLHRARRETPRQLPDEASVEIHDADFTWDASSSRQPILRAINLCVLPGSLTIIVGAVGSGKSSLMGALLGEMHQIKGSRSVRGAIAYASQQPWIQHNSVRENILFGSAYDQARYNDVVRACQLQPDFKALEHGDATEIGERGINLSGGQKARVSLARVMYRLAAADLLILDDPLSALDVHVANAVFNACVMKLARDKTRLLVLNSHYHLLKNADRVVVMSNGEIVGEGTFDEVSKTFPHLEVQVLNTASSSEDHSVQADQHCDDDRTESSLVESGEDGEADGKEKPSSMMIAEDRVVGGVTWGTYGSYLASSGWGSGAVLGVALLVAFAVGQCAIVATDYFVTFWSDGTLHDVISRETTLLWIFIAITIGATLLSIARAVFFTEICVQSSSKLHAKYFERVLLAPLGTFFDVTPVGRVLNRFSRDLDQIDNPLPYWGLALLVYLMLTLAILVVCAVTTPTTLALYAPLCYVCYWLQKRFLATSRELKRLDGITRSPFLNLIAETINGLESIRAFDMTQHFSNKCRELVDHNSKFYFMFQQSSNWFVMRLDWLVTTVVVAVSFTVVAWSDSVGAASAGIALTYAVQLTMNFQRLMTRASAVDNFLTSFERLSHYSSLQEEGEGDASATPSLTSSWPSQGSIEFRGVWLRYREGLDFVLKDVTFSIRDGEKIGVCGRTGSGKSTIMNAIFRTTEISAGTVFIDGVNIAHLPVQILRAKLTIIPQDPVLFSGTLRQNLDPFNEKSDADLFLALRKVHLADDVAKWGAGLSYEIVEKGENISVGQRQLICIARALLRDSRIVLVDEATASVDQALDRLIQVSIKENFHSCTTLTIAHRLETIADSDRVLVMDHGLVAEFDSPQHLMAKQDGLFASLMHAATSKPY